jgi:inosine-uridine nucleoside N-ribohydrolase
MMKIHLDTDLGGDIDDLCALAMLLRMAEVEITGITVVGDDHGRRTGYVRYVLGLAERSDIPVAAGADVSQGHYRYELGLPDEERYWPEPIDPSPNPVQQALDLLYASIEQGATIIGIGPYTNLALVELQRPGILMQANLFLMGGYIYPTRSGFPQWGNEIDFNIQVDVRSARHVIENSHPTLIPLPITIQTALRRAYLEDLRGSGSLGALIARQAEAFALDEQYETKFGETCPGLPADIINFQHDPLACAIATGWNEGVEIEAVKLALEVKAGWLIERTSPGGRPAQVVTKVDAARFNEFWFNLIKTG